MASGPVNESTILDIVRVFCAADERQPPPPYGLPEDLARFFGPPREGARPGLGGVEVHYSPPEDSGFRRAWLRQLPGDTGWRTLYVDLSVRRSVKIDRHFAPVLGVWGQFVKRDGLVRTSLDLDKLGVKGQLQLYGRDQSNMPVIDSFAVIRYPTET